MSPPWCVHRVLHSKLSLRAYHSQSVTVTNVTLKVGTGYQVEFVSPQNHSDVFAVGNTFDVKAPGSV